VTRNVRWECPTSTVDVESGATVPKHRAVLAPSRPRADDVRRFCLPCSEATGKLVRRVSTTLAKERDRRSEARRAKEKGRALARKAREVAYYTVAGVDLRALMTSYCRAKAWRGTPVGNNVKPPELRIRRTKGQPRRYGTAWWHRYRIQIVDYPGVGEHDVKETLIHELAHLAAPRDHHGIKWKTVFRLACEELLGVRPKVERRYHGEVSSKLRAAAEEIPEERREEVITSFGEHPSGLDRLSAAFDVERLP